MIYASKNENHSFSEKLEANLNFYFAKLKFNKTRPKEIALDAKKRHVKGGGWDSVPSVNDLNNWLVSTGASVFHVLLGWCRVTRLSGRSRYKNNIPKLSCAGDKIKHKTANDRMISWSLLRFWVIQFVIKQNRWHLDNWTCSCDHNWWEENHFQYQKNKHISPNLTLLLYILWWHNEPHQFIERPKFYHTHCRCDCKTFLCFEALAYTALRL